MILQALKQLADREGLVEDPDYEYKPIAWLVRLDSQGRLVGFEGTHQLQTAQGRRKARAEPKRFSVPRQPTGRTGTKAPPCFLVDNAKYVFGRPTADKTFDENEGSEKAGWFRDLVAQCAEATGDDAIKAVVAFLDDARASALVLPEGAKSNELFGFVVGEGTELVHLRPAVRRYWSQLRSKASGTEDDVVTCLVTGTALPSGQVGLFPPVKRVPGGSTSGVGLVSFNKGAFESYGWKSNRNANISRAAAEASATALNRLLDPNPPNPRRPDEDPLAPRSLRISSDTVVAYWPAEESGDPLADSLEALLAGETLDAAIVGDLFRSVHRGRAPHIDDACAFYALTLTGTQGRAIVRGWIESSVALVVEHLASHFRDLEVVRGSGQPSGEPTVIPLKVMIRALAPQGKEDAIAPALACDFVNAALQGTPYPLSLLQRALIRTRAEIGQRPGTHLDTRARQDARAAVIKGVLKRHFRLEVTVAMDPSNASPAYLLGRLMAVIERMQVAALGDVNASVVDRYFGAASATPAVVFPRLLKNLRNHARKAKDDDRTAGTARWLESEVDNIVSRLGGFPAHLDLPAQGLFVIGYHHERHWLWLPKEQRAGAEAVGPPA
jgi:CRISPR-associated protein Csd1